jgi:putative flippase GtrA
MRLLGPTGQIRRAAYFGVVSACSVVFTQVVLVSLQLAGMSAALANALAVTLAAILTYLASRRWVWRRSRRAGRTTEVVLFGLTTAVGFVLSTGLVWLLVPRGAPVLYASAINIGAFGAVWIVKYLVLDAVVFAPRSAPGELATSDWTPQPPHSWNGSRAPREPSWLPSVMAGRQRAAEWWGPVAVAIAALLLMPAVTVSALTSMEDPNMTNTGYPGRPGASEGDQEADLGEPVTIEGLVATVERAKFVRGIGRLDEGRYLKVTVTVENTSDTTARVRRAEWRVRTPAGHVYEAAVTTSRDATDRRIGPGARTRGRLFFEVGPEEGVFYVMHAPDGGRSGRSVWRVVAK